MLYSTTVSTLLSLEVTFLLSLQFRLLRIVEVTRFGYCKSWGSVSDNIRLWHYQYQIISVSGCGIQIINISLNYKQNLLSQKSLFGMIVVRALSTDSPLRSAHRRLFLQRLLPSNVHCEKRFEMPREKNVWLYEAAHVDTSGKYIPNTP